MKRRVADAENFRTRSVLVQQEFEDCTQFFQRVGLRGVFLIFGSARSRSHAQLEEARTHLNKKIETVKDEAEKTFLERQVAALKRKEWMAPVWDTTAQLSKLLTEWTISPEGVAVGNQIWSLLPGGNEQQPLMVCTGGGPGYMEAGNLGASQVPGAKSIGVAVKLPFETELNPYVEEDHGITVNSFYVRKYWEVYAVKAMICCPGGFGTLDEMFEVLTLVQCKHCPQIPVVLLGKDFWQGAINFQFLADHEVIAKDDIDRLLMTDSAEEAFQHIVSGLKYEAERMASAPCSPKPLRVAETSSPSRSQPQAPPFRRERDAVAQNLGPDGAVITSSQQSN